MSITIAPSKGIGH